MLEHLPAEGLAHLLIRTAPGRVLRVPRYSQVSDDPQAHLLYQAESFRRAAASGHVPALHVVHPPGADFPLGALEVEEIDGRLPRLDAAGDWQALGVALGRIHALPLPSTLARPPLRDATAEPLDILRRQIGTQAAGFADWPIARAGREVIAEALSALPRLRAPVRGGHARALCLADCHPGNFLITAEGRAVFVDLERMQYGCPAFDLLHAVGWPANAWDPRLTGRPEEMPGGVGQAADRLLAGWSAQVPTELAMAVAAWLPLAPFLVALRSVTWLGRFLHEGLDRLPTEGPGWAADRQGVATRIQNLLAAPRLAAVLTPPL